MILANYRRILRNGLWDNNPGLVQLLGLCPLLAVSNTLINALGMGLATTAVLLASNVTISLTRGAIRDEVRIPVFVLVIASFVTAVDLVMQAWFLELHHILGIFIPLIVTNCVIIGRAEAFAARNPVGPSAVDGLAMGLGFTAVLIVLGGLREIIGQGTLLAGAHLMFGEAARSWVLGDPGAIRGVLLMLLPPGAFIGLGLLVAAKRALDLRAERRITVAAAEPEMV
jgi:H+/Na+-translocating ferredoxin:NAD+ oxidoreductase subunit E